MDRSTQQEIEDQQILSAATFQSSLNLTTLPPTDVSIVKSFIEDVYPVYPPTSPDTPLEFLITSNSTYFTDPSSIELEMLLKITTGTGSFLTSTSKTVPGNFPFASIFSNLDIYVNNVAITKGSNNYPYAAFINRAISHGTDSLNTKLKMEKFFKEDVEDATIATNKTYHNLKGVGQEFEVVGKIAHGIFEQNRMFPPSTSIRIKLRRATNTFSLLGDAPASGSNFTDVIKIEDAVLKVRRCIVNTKVEEKIKKDLLQGEKMGYKFKDFDVVSYSIPQGWSDHVSDVIQMGPSPDAVVIGFVTSKAYAGSVSKSPFFFKPFNLTSISVTLDGEPQVVNELRLNTSKKRFNYAYSQIFKMIPKTEGTTFITPENFLENGASLFVFDINNAVKDDRFALTRSGALKIHCKFGSALSENVQVICYLVQSRLLGIDNQNQVYLK